MTNHKCNNSAIIAIMSNKQVTPCIPIQILLDGQIRGQTSETSYAICHYRQYRQYLLIEPEHYTDK